MTNKRHQSEHEFVDTIRNWHKAVDGRGIDKDILLSVSTKVAAL